MDKRQQKDAANGAPAAYAVGGSKEKQKPASDALKRVELGVAVIAIVVAMVLHVRFVVHSPALWRDEINSVNLASMPSLSSVFRGTEFESFPPMWTLLLRLWLATGVGTTDSGLRLFGLLGGLSTLVAVWFGVQRLSRRVPLIALALIAVNPEFIRWGDSVRAWGLASALAVIALAMVYRVSQTPTAANVALAAGAAILSVQCTYQNAVLLAAIVGGVILVPMIQGRWKTFLLIGGIGAAAGLTLLPYVPIMQRVSQWNMLGNWSFGLRDFTMKVKEVMAASGNTGLRIWNLLIVGAIIAALAAFFRRRGVDDPDNVRDVCISAGAVMVAAMIALAGFYIYLAYPTQSWYYLAMLALVASSAEIAVVSVARSSTLAIARVVIAMLALVAGFLPAWQSLEGPQTNMDAIGAQLREESAEQDMVILHPWYYALTFDRYYRGPSQVTTIPPLDDRKLHRYDLVKRAMESADPTPALLKDVQRTLDSGHKVWLIGAFSINPDAVEIRPLPPPPLPDTAWHAEPYTDLWALELTSFLRDRALTTKPVPIAAPGGRFEAPSVTVIQGWKK